jgi:cytidylate kinase
MRTWALSLQMPERPTHDPVALHRLIRPYIAISRQAGIDADAVARELATRLGWQALDREVLDYLAEDKKWCRYALECVDERPASWLTETLGKWLDRTLVTQAEYLEALAHVFVLAAQHQSTVFVGRGAQFILPRDAGFAVRLVASTATRAEAVMAQQRCDKQTALRFIAKQDAQRSRFIDSHFHHDVADPTLYDLVINLDHLAVEAVVRIIASYLNLR